MSRTARSGSRAASCTAAPRGSARLWLTSPSASSTPSSSRAERGASSGSGLRRFAAVGSVGRDAYFVILPATFNKGTIEVDRGIPRAVRSSDCVRG